MHVKLKNQIPSIQQMYDFDLPDFAVIIGRNGVGKTQLLKAIAGGSVVISDVPSPDVELYDINSFQPQDSGKGGWGHAGFFHMTVARYFSAASGLPLIQVSEKIYTETINKLELVDDTRRRNEFESAARVAIGRAPDFGELGKVRGDGPVFDYLDMIRNNVFSKLQKGNQSSGQSQRDTTASYNNNQAALICQAMKLSRKLPHELNREDVRRASHYEGNIVGNQLSQIFARYKAEQYAWAHTESEESDKSVKRLMKEYREEHPPPWETLRVRIDRMREASYDPELFNFVFSDPEEDTLTYANHSQYTFETKFTNRATGDSYSVKNLSSGEKILLCLCLLAFNRDIGRRQPALVLFDELDALLHPSMISALIAGLKDQFVDNNTRVIMATHSVTTVSLLEEGEIFRLTRSGTKLNVLPVAQARAVADLSEGIATIEDGLKIAASGRASLITILTEGNNALHLKRWAKLFFPNQIEVFEKLPSRTGKNELSSYGRLLASMEATSHFLIVWDSDAKKEAEKLQEEIGESRNVTAFAFEKRENTIASKGIENAYEEDVLEQYATTSTRATTEETFVTMSSQDKREFAGHVMANATKEYFRHFSGLENVVREILDAQRAGELGSTA